MKSIALQWVRIALFAGLVLCPATVPAAERWTEARIREILSERIEVAQQSVGIVVGYIDDDGRIVVGHGKLGPDNAGRPDGETVFEIGSVTKVFTGILLADMAESGKVKLKDPVQNYLPETVRLPVRNERPITLYDLATHTSGLPRMPGNFSPTNMENPYVDYSALDMYEFLADYELPREPGAGSEYSNLGMGLLGHVLALQANTDYESLVKRRVSIPLGMRETMITLTPKLQQRLAHGHNADLRPVSNWDLPALGAAGALKSTVNDMLKFVAANLGFTETEISAALQSARQPREDASLDDTRVGLAWFVSSRNGRTITWHNGGTGGYHSFVGIDLERRRGVVVLSNASPSIDDIGFHLLEPKIPLAKITPPAVAVEVPATPAGVALTRWLDVTRSEDDGVARAHYEANFAEEFKSAVPVDSYMMGRGGLRTLMLNATVGRTVARSDLDLTVYVSSGGTWFAVHIQVTEGEPHRITGLLIQPSEPPEDSD